MRSTFPLLRNLRHGLLAVLLTASTSGWTQDTVTPMRIEVGFSAGGTTDALARVVARQLAADLKTPVLVNNRPGANGNIAAAYVAGQPADGNLLYMGSFNNPVNHAANKKLPFDFMRDFAPVAMVAYVPNVLIVGNASPIHSVRDLIVQARRQPGTLSFGSAGPGSSLHMAGELFKRSTGVDILHAPYKGSAPAISDLMGGHIDMMFDNLPSAMQLVKSGKVRALAVTSARRQDALPDVPTLAESGLPQYEVTSFFALFARTGTPPATLAQLNAAVNALLVRPEVRGQIEALGAQASAESPAQLRAYTVREVDKWKKVIQEARIELE